MRNIGGKKLLRMAAAILACVIVIGSTVCAADGQRRDGINSHGTINYDGGKVVLNSADYNILANRMDALETSFKTETAGALAKMKTYIQPDGSISHDSEADIDLQRVAFSNLAKAILQSQSVTHLKDAQADNGSVPLYYKFEKNNMLEVTTENTGMPVFIVPATEDNLTAGTAAWVNGQCLVGNGSDNYYFYRKGFIEGYADKVGAMVEYQYDDSGKIESAKLIFP